MHEKSKDMILKIGKIENFRFYKSSIRLKENTSNEFYKLWGLFQDIN